MDFERKPALLYADLFKSPKHNKNLTPPDLMSQSDFGSGSSSTNPSSFCDSSSSELSSPFGSELDSSESDDGDYMAELTRQMAECMLQEEEEEEELEDSKTISSPVKNYNMNQRNIDSAAINNLKNGLYLTRKAADDRTPPLQVCNFKNQPPVSKLSGRLKGAESTQQIQKTEQQFYMQYRGRVWRNKVQAGSGMQAVFLGQSGSRNGSTGTGVFLPRGTTDSTALKKKSGCSTVLIPTRVLQTLELHFNRRLDSGAPPSNGGCGSPNYPSNFKDESTQTNGKRNGESQSQNCPTKHDDDEDEMQLPKEWTY